MCFFRKDYEKLDQCPLFEASRCNNPEAKKIPHKVLYHFLLIPRLKRLFSSKTIAEGAQWHQRKRPPVENELRADGEAYKSFDKHYEWFAEDARNIRFGLVTDGFNTCGNISSSYNLWPVFVIPYNFAPWDCMDQSNFMMTLVIPSAAKDFDVFMDVGRSYAPIYIPQGWCTM